MENVLPSRFFTRVDRDGLIEVVDLETGHIVRKESVNGMIDPYAMSRIETPTGPIYMPRDIAPPASVKKVEFNRFLAERICDFIMEGQSLTEICKKPGFPSYNIVSRWALERHEFAEALRIAREMRSEVYHDRILEEAESTDEDNAKASKVRIDALKWAAEKGHPSRYGNKVHVVSEKTVSISVNTGFGEIEQRAVDAECREV